MPDTSLANSNNNAPSPNGDEQVHPIQEQIVEIPLDQILPNDKNPRGSIDQAVVDALKASMAIEGQKTPIKTRQLPEAERLRLPSVAHRTNSLYRVVGGDHRVLAARQLGWKTIKGVVLNITAEETFLEGYLDNQGKEMGWFSDFKAAEALWNQNQDPQKTQKAVADRLMKSEALVSKALKLLPLLNSSAREAILSQGKKPESEQVTQKAIYCLTALATGGNADTDRIWAALKVVLDRQMTEPQVQKLVAWIQKGNSPESFPASGKAEVQKGSKNQRFDPNDPLADIWKDLPKGAKIHKTPKGYQLSWKLSEADAPLAVKGALAALAGTKGGNPNQPVANANQPLSSQNSDTNPSVLIPTPIVPQAASITKIYVFRDLLAGINVVHKIQQKIAKGETPTLLESVVLGGYRLGQGIHLLWKKFIEPSLKSFSEKIEKTFGKTLYYIFIALLLWYVAWKVWPVFQAVLHPIHWIESRFHVDSHSESTQSSPVSQLAASTQMSQTILPKMEVAVTHLAPEKKTEKPIPTIAYQPSISFIPTVYDPKYFESEIQALPQNCIVKAFPLQPDEGMPVDLATSRLQDLTDTEKHTMKIGSGTEKILSVIPSNSTLTVNYKGTDALGTLFGDHQGQRIFFWEDVLVIHSDEIDIQSKTPSVIYQCSLIVNDSKNPLIIQCASAADLKHLVSTMEYFIRTSRLGHDTALAGMPYPSQGLRLNNDGVVTTLWAGSPVDTAGVKVSDMIWSLGKNEQVPQDHKKLETQLAALAPGQHTLYIANNADFTKAQSDVAFNRASSLNPKRHKVLLMI